MNTAPRTRFTQDNSGSFKVIAALHLPSYSASGSIQQIIDYTLRNTAYAVQAGVNGLYIQDIGDYPWAPEIQPHTLARMSVVGAALKREFPDLNLGVCLMSHGAKGPLAIAQAIGASFVRLKVYVGAMIKAEGLLQGCAYEAITYRDQIGANEIAILADIYDRTGEPLGQLPLIDAATQAAIFGRADGLILTGHNLESSLEMLAEVHDARLDVPLFLGGGAKPENLPQVLAYADGVIVSTAFKAKGGWTHAALAEDWDAGAIAAFMEAVEKVSSP